MEKKTRRILNAYPLKDGLYPIRMRNHGYQAHNNIKAMHNPVDEWYRILGHPHPNRQYDLSRMQNDVPMFARDSFKEHQCIPCTTAALSCSKIPDSTRKTTRLLELVHLDISGKVQPSIDGYIYTVAFLDDFTAKSDVKPLEKKSELFKALTEYKATSENQLQEYGYRLTNIRLDGAGENLSNDVKFFCQKQGIRIEPSPPYAPQINGAAERLIQEHWTRARILLFASNLPNNLWPQAIQQCNWLRNRLPANRIDGGIPILHWDKNIRIRYTQLLEFGTPGFAFIYRSDTAKGKKFLPRSQYRHLVGMASETSLINVYIPQTKKIFQARRNDFRKHTGTILPSIQVLLDGIAKQVADEEREESLNNQPAAMLMNALLMPRIQEEEVRPESPKFIL